jgi:hypothetical protein
LIELGLATGMLSRPLVLFHPEYGTDEAESTEEAIEQAIQWA